MFKERHFVRSVILLSGRWYLAYNLSLRDLEEMMAEPAATAEIILSGIEMIHMMRKRQARLAYQPRPSITELFEILAA